MRFALVRDLEPHPAAVVGRAHAAQEPGRFEPVDMTGHPGCRHALAGRELAHARARRAADQVQQRRLPAADAKRGALAAQLAVEAQQRRTQPVGQGNGIGGDCEIGHFVNQVSEY